MAILSGFFPSVNGDRKYTNDFLAKWVHSFIGNGVYDGDFAVTAGENMNVILPKGQAWINGYYCRNDGNIVLPIENADGVLNRKDIVVLRWDINTRDISVKILTGKFASEPTAPPIVRSAEQFDLKLAEIDIPAGATKITQADITDTRLDNKVCGIVTGLIKQADTTALYKQIQSDLLQFKSGSEADFSSWSAEQKNAFEAWLEGIKTVLDEDTAGNLLNLINAVKTDFNSHASDPIHIQPGEREKWNASGVSTYKHEKTGTVHNLKGTGNNIEFLATADIADGDTWTVNGKDVTATLSNGEPLTEDTFKSGNWVTGVRLDGDKLNFRSSGGGGCNFNIFVQPDEPDIREGIWFKSAKESYKGVVVDAQAYKDGSWIPSVTKSMPTPRESFGIAVVGTKIHCIGGYDNQKLKTHEVYDVNTGNWSTEKSMPTARSLFGVAVVGTKIHCIGGSDNDNRLKTHEVYDVNTGNWSTEKSMPTARSLFGIAVVGTKIHCIGGRDNHALNTHEVYDVNTGNWSTEESMPTARSFFGVAVVGTEIHCIGGEKDTGDYFTTHEVYNTNTNTWSTAKSITVSGGRLHSVTLENKIHCIYDDGLHKGEHKVYNPNTDSWSTEESMLTARSFFGVAVVGTEIHCIGGRNTGIHEVYALKQKNYPENTIVILSSSNISDYATQFYINKKLTGRLVTYFTNAWLVKGGKLQDYDSYYGNGTEWIKFK